MKVIRELEQIGYKFILDNQMIAFKQIVKTTASTAYIKDRLDDIKENKEEAIQYLKWRDLIERSVVLDLETTHKSPKKGKIRLISLADIHHTTVFENVELVRKLLLDSNILKIFHNAAFDVTWLEEKGFEVNNYADTMIMAQVLSNSREGLGLKELVTKELAIDINKDLQNESNWDKDLTYSHYIYSLCDAAVTRQLAIKLFHQIDKRGLFLTFLRETRALPAIIRLQRDGMPFSKQEWLNQLFKIGDKKNDIEHKILTELNTTINLNSPKQLLSCLSNREINLPDTKDETLAHYQAQFPILKQIRVYREYHKILTLSGEKWLNYCQVDGRMYPNWWLIGTVTGRMSCSSPNLQQVPHLLRPYFKATKGHVFIVADYSQIELRVIAELTKDPELVHAFNQGIDLHKKTAQMILKKDDISSKDRQVAKAANFGLIYGMTEEGLQKRVKTQYGLEINLKQASSFRNGFFKLYRRVKRYQERQLQQQNISSLGGRVWRDIPEWPNPGWRNRYNYAVQGTAADGLKEALPLLLERMKSSWKLCALVHDEVVLEVPIEDQEEAKTALSSSMVEGMKVFIKEVPIEVDVNCEYTWQK